MSRGQVLTGQISPKWLASVKDDSRNLPLKFGQEQLKYCGHWVCVVGGWVVGGVCKVIFMSNPTVVLRLGLGWGFDNNSYYNKRTSIFWHERAAFKRSSFWWSTAGKRRIGHYFHQSWLTVISDNKGLDWFCWKFSKSRLWISDYPPSVMVGKWWC